MNAADIVGYTADADTYCVDCARERYPAEIDSEGNDVHPIFASDEWDRAVHCADCGEEIVEGPEEGPFDRFDIVEAYAVYAHDYGLYGLADRIEQLPFRARTERQTLTPSGKAIYDRLRASAYAARFLDRYDRRPAKNV